MKIAIRPADLERDREVMICTLQRYLTPSSNARRFDWLYKQNPHGSSLAWLAEDSESGEIVGASAAFPRRAIVSGRGRRGWVLGDFCVADKYRSLGPALQLQRATLAAIAQLPDSEFCYDFPSRKLTAIYHRLGIQPACQMVRLTKPLRFDQQFSRFTRLRTLGKPLRWFANLVLEMFDYRFKGRDWDISLVKDECGSEFNELTEKTDFSNSLEIERSAEFLNWRYLQHPFFPHHILTAREAGRLKGYLVFTCRDNSAEIADWNAGDHPELLKSLVRHLVKRLRSAGIITLNAFLLQSDPRIKLLKEMGFWARESNPVMASWTGIKEICPSSWTLMQGDRDS